MTEPRPRRPREAADEPLKPAANVAEPTSLVPAAPVSVPAPVRGGALPAVAGTTGSQTASAEPRGGSLLPWGRAAVAIAVVGSAIALGTRALFERVMGPVPYDLPSDGAMLAAIALASAAGAAMVGWTSATARQPAPAGAPKSWSNASNFSYMVVAMVAVAMLNGAYRNAGEIDASRGLDLPLAVVERRAELRPAHIPSQYALGVAYYHAGRYLDAERSADYVRELADGVRYPSSHRDDADLSGGEVLRPADVYPRAKELSILAHAHLARATALSMLARAHRAPPDAALDLYRKAYEIGGPSPEASRALYDALVAARLYPEASNVAGSYVRLHPDDPAWGRLYRLAWDAARQAEVASMLPVSGAANPEITRFEKEARENPDDAYPEAYLAFAELKDVLGTQLQWRPANFDRPLIHARRAVSLAPKNPDYLAQLGLIQTFGEHWASADSAFAAAVALDPRVLERHDGFDAAWETAKARMRGDAGPGIQRFMLQPPRKP